MNQIPKSVLQQSLKVYDYWIAGWCVLFGFLSNMKLENNVTVFVAHNLFHTSFETLAPWFFYYGVVMIMMGIISIVSITNWNNRLRYVMASFLIAHILMSILQQLNDPMTSLAAVLPLILTIISIVLRLLWVFRLDLSITE